MKTFMGYGLEQDVGSSGCNKYWVHESKEGFLVSGFEQTWVKLSKVRQPHKRTEWRLSFSKVLELGKSQSTVLVIDSGPCRSERSARRSVRKQLATTYNSLDEVLDYR